MQTLEGKVVGNKNAKTIMVAVESVSAHPKYGKLIKKTTKLQVHNDGEAVSVGSVVRIVSCKPMSKTKSFKLDKVLVKGLVEETNAQNKANETIKANKTIKTIKTSKAKKLSV